MHEAATFRERLFWYKEKGAAMAATSQNKEKFEDYEGFLEKFRPKKTTDDCYTPEQVYEAAAKYVAAWYGVERSRMVRPFWPGADYKSFRYVPESVVVDNPPFSILAEIIQWYLAKKIHFFLFAPALTVMGNVRFDGVTAIFANADITYENGAKVPTAFVTSLDPDFVTFSDPLLGEMINEAVKKTETERKQKKNVKKYIYPTEVVTGAMINTWVSHGAAIAIRREDAVFIRGLDSQYMVGKNIFGGDFYFQNVQRQNVQRQNVQRRIGGNFLTERRKSAKNWEQCKTRRKVT